MLCWYWAVENAVLLLRGRRCYVAIDCRRCYVATCGQKMLCCYWEAEDAMLLLRGTRCYVATEKQKMLSCCWQAEDDTLLLTTNIKFPVLQLLWRPRAVRCTCFFYIGNNTVRVKCSRMTAVWLVVARVSSHCIACMETVIRGCSTTRGRWFGSGLPACSGTTDMLLYPSRGQNCTFFTDHCASLINHTQLWCYLPTHTITSLSFQCPACNCHLVASNHGTVIYT